jgi:mannose-6-phosphate isomerase-like protein (cupin superfamily)
MIRVELQGGLGNQLFIWAMAHRLSEEYKVPVGEWHQLTNPFDVPLKIVEIQYGSQCDEDDIERKLL